jgi:hypothetical protein
VLGHSPTKTFWVDVVEELLNESWGVGRTVLVHRELRHKDLGYDPRATFHQLQLADHLEEAVGQL